MMLARGGTPGQARAYRQKGHDDALQFALHLGLDRDYTQHRLILRNCTPKVCRSDLRIATVGNWNSLLR